MPHSKLAQRVARRYLERKGYSTYPATKLPDEDTPDLDSWRERPALPDGEHSQIPGDDDDEDELDGQTGKWTR